MYLKESRKASDNQEGRIRDTYFPKLIVGVDKTSKNMYQAAVIPFTKILRIYSQPYPMRGRKITIETTKKAGKALHTNNLPKGNLATKNNTQTKTDKTKIKRKF